MNVADRSAKARTLAKKITATPTPLLDTVTVQELIEFFHYSSKITSQVLILLREVKGNIAEANQSIEEATRDEDIYYQEGRAEALAVVETQLQYILGGIPSE